ncbi:hypothetical protein [Natronococcus amylolyticus]|uniref:hypothetical protein n=1 Tax=Natronococcus amylolyticus TaxID=44470 RepID=UPI001360B093|nr:hypothetical protein [Natronococcus amylolyticus]
MLSEDDPEAEGTSWVHRNARRKPTVKEYSNGTPHLLSPHPQTAYVPLSAIAITDVDRN